MKPRIFHIPLLAVLVLLSLVLFLNKNTEGGTIKTLTPHVEWEK